ncbi:hypothetical protein MLD38_028233 [Melastoma candidum]|uniref:Uncharacterized protein n=1 Tax=Melastoma candidum TaxID=119954 RepID=A0ACB9N6F6_9MYRT|nr:hypothetical protein MLD38_028233 [Melastoma candidum]
MEINELFMCPPPPPPASASASDYDDLLPPLTFPLITPQLHIDSSSSSSSSCFPFLNFTPHFHLDGRGLDLDLDSVLGPLSSLSSATTTPVATLPWNPLLEHEVTPLPRNCDSPNCRDKSSTDGSSVSELFPGKRRCLDRGKPKGPSKFAERGDDSVVTTTKRSREDEEVDGGDGIGPARQRQPKLGIGAEEEDEGRKKKSKKEKKGRGGDDGVEPPKDYIHVRARRGQATDSHSLAERVRREKISERMKMLQDLVPSCSKVTGKALMLDEIINYVQSLQRQVEFLSMKLASVDTNMNHGMNARIILKDMFQSTTITTTATAQLPMFEPPLCEKMQEGTNFKYLADPPLSDSRIPPLNGLDDGILAPFRSEDLHSIVGMGLFGQTNLLGLDGQGQMNNNNNSSMDMMMEEHQQ